MWQFWRRHSRKVYATLGVLGSGYLLYKLYGSIKRRSREFEIALALEALESDNDKLLKAQMQEHFEKIQKIADSTTSHVMQYLSSRIAEELDLTPLTERLMKGKGQPNTLATAEKLELWDRLKILSFTRMALSLWTMTILNLYVRVQVNILGRHLYIGTARDLGSSNVLEEAELIEQTDEQQFLATADFLTNHAFPELISSLEAATFQVLKGKQLKDFFVTSSLHETLLKILDTFMSMGSPNQWIRYLMSEDVQIYDHVSTSGGSGSQAPSVLSKFEQLMLETRAVISSAEFFNVLEDSLKVMVEALVKEIEGQQETSALTSGMPLAKLVPRIAHMSLLMVEQPPNREHYIQIISKNPEVEQFFTLLYSACLLP